MNHFALAASGLAVLACTAAAAQETLAIRFLGGPLAGGSAEIIPTDPSFAEDEGIAGVQAAWFETDGYIGAVRWVRLKGQWQWENQSYLSHASRFLEAVVPGEQERVSGDRDTVNGFLGEHRIVQVDSQSGRMDCGAYSLHRNHDLVIGFLCGDAGRPVQIVEAMQNLEIDGVIGP